MGFALPSGVVNTDSVYYYADATFAFGPLVKELRDQTLVVVDYSTTTGITGVHFSVDVSSNPALVVSYPKVDATGRVLTFLLSGGIVGQQYNLSIHTQIDINARVDVLKINIPSSSGDCAQINPVPEVYTQLPLGEPTQGYVNTGVRYFWGDAPPANPNVMDQWYSPSTRILYEWVTDGEIFFWQIIMSAYLVEEAPKSNLLFSRYNGEWVADPVQADVLDDGQGYTRVAGTWRLAAIQVDAPIDSQQYARTNGGWAVVAPPFADAPLDGNLYGRRGGGWDYAYSVSNPAGYQTEADVDATLDDFLPLSGGEITGTLTVTDDFYVGENSFFTGNANFAGSVALSNDPISDMQAATKRYVDNAIATADLNSPFLPLAGGVMNGAITLAADPVTMMQAANKRYVDDLVDAATANGPFLPILGGTITGDLRVNGITMLSREPTAPLEAATKAYVDANSAGGIGDAPLDGQTYGRANNAWSVALAITGGTLTGALVLAGNPTTGLQAATKTYVDGQISNAVGGAPFLPLSGGTLTGPLLLNAAPTVSLQAATKGYVDGKSAVQVPLINGTAQVGSSALFAREDHVHPTDTTRYAASNPSGYQTASQVTGTVQGAASTTFPLMDGTQATGTGTTWARADHVHPSDTTRYAASNPAGYQTAAQVSAYVTNAIANATIDCGEI